jgi:hypothetical protein
MSYHEIQLLGFDALSYVIADMNTIRAIKNERPKRAQLQGFYEEDVM